ncbi:hypothetical protein H310_00682 [Aphanomyces invadans]|uniref:Uncharacterized protein n=1 Tax=Aphanomyces invadans TaxID=157072 RepID=A0A024UV18_9STRA|nr:hypothetical protein H310_00682 [Aphanomyces invadans]ETW10361.1 hypothetical protein H310_00682 [Aphanomyces invadans]|eukprot:XP_008861772.1 hypothetical protein H310_00682 [Aphanomyces invadans]
MRAWYKALSNKYPRLVAGVTATTVLTSADITCQIFLQPPEESTGYDWSRTAGLATFGLVYYGGPCKSLYLHFDKVMGTTPTARTVAIQTFVDCYIHTPLALIPAFYYITNGVKGKSVAETTVQLRREWFTASFGSVLFWTPVQVVNFWVVPQHSKILFVACFSFMHKTWLSWLANRHDREQRRHLVQPDAAAAVDDST